MNLKEFNSLTDLFFYQAEKQNSQSIFLEWLNTVNRKKFTWSETVSNIYKLAKILKEHVKQGDRVAAILPNIPEAIISFLGTAKIGAIWSSCSADFGPNAIIDRFKQISPKILIISDYYYYNNKKIFTLDKIEDIKKEITSIKKIIIIPYELVKINYKVKYEYQNWLSILEKSSSQLKYENFNFNK